jgi:integrase
MIEQCYRRAHKLSFCRPEHYLFPFRVTRGTYDPTRPPSCCWLRDSWNKLREHTGLTTLCPHDLRHQCITRMLENGMGSETVRVIAGHMGGRAGGTSHFDGSLAM